MSMPIIACLVVKAAKGDEEAYVRLVKNVRANMKCGHFTQVPCACSPKCECTDEELVALNDRLIQDVGDVEEDV